MEAPTIELTDDQKKGMVEKMKKRVELHKLDFVTNNGDKFRVAKIFANTCISYATGGFMSWDDLPDINSLWDYIDGCNTLEELLDQAIEASNERLEGSMG